MARHKASHTHTQSNCTHHLLAPCKQKTLTSPPTGRDITLPGDLTGSSSGSRGQRPCLRRFTAFHSPSAAAGSSSHSRLPPEGLPCSQEDTGTGGVAGNFQGHITGSPSNSVGTEEGRREGVSPEDCVVISHPEMNEKPPRVIWTIQNLAGVRKQI